MDLRKQRPSDRIEDHTGRGDFAKLLDYLFTQLNPALAYRNLRSGGNIPYEDRIVTFKRGRDGL